MDVMAERKERVMADMDLVQALIDNLNGVIRGKDAAVRLLVTALLSEGHVLIEDVPGTGKTTLAKALAKSVDVSFSRIQFTPDLLPTDIIGGMVYSASSGDFNFRPGPVFCHILLGDEINRASPRTQSALLEAMSEHQVTIEGQPHLLLAPFLVLATQNPVEYNGTYPLPEAQLDRFAIQVSLGYPALEDERQLVMDQQLAHPLDSLQAVMDGEQVVSLQEAVRKVKLEASVMDYALALVRATREQPRLELGASPRAALDLCRMARARAFIDGRDYVIPDDVKQLAIPVMAHRLVLDVKSRHAGVSGREIVGEILSTIEVPV